MKRKKIALSVISCAFAATCFGGTLGLLSSAENVPTPKRYAELWKAGAQTTVIDNVDAPLYATTGAVKGSSTPSDKLPAWRRNGVEIRADGALNNVEFANIVNVDGFTSADRLIDILPIANIQGTHDFNSLTVTVTDADDPSVWFSVGLSGVSVKWRPAGTYATVTTSTGAKGAYRWGIAYQTLYGSCEFDINSFLGTVTVPSSVEDKTPTDYMALPYSIRYDEDSQMVYVTDGYNGLQCLYDLDHTETVGVGKEFPGFKNGRVKISVKASSIVNSPASYLVLNVANHGMNGERIVNENAPDAIIDAPESLPLAEVGLAYRLFSAEFYDLEDGALAYSTYVKEPDGSEFVRVENSFTPTKAGDYVLRYEAIDSFGEKSIKDITVRAQYGVPNAVISVQPEEKTFVVGEEITIPKANVTGGSGVPALTTNVENTYGGTVVLENGKFTPMVSGVYRITYTATDYLHRVVTRCLDYEVQKTNTALLKSPAKMYGKFVSGVAVELPTLNAVDYYSQPGQGLAAKTEITVKGTGDKSGYSEKLTGYTFTPDSEIFGDEIIVEYSVFCKNYPERAQVVSFTVPVCKPDYVWDYFSYDDEKIRISYNTLEELRENNDSYVSFNAKQSGDASFAFINPLRAEDFTLQFAVEESQKGFDGIQVTLRDYFDSSVCLTYQIREKDDKSTYVLYGDTEREMLGGLTSKSILSLAYKQDGLYDYSGKRIVECSEFAGFPSGKVWAEVTLLNAQADAGVKLSRFGSQPLGAAYRSGNLSRFSDVITPEIVLKNKLCLEPFYNELVKIPAAVAYDVCSPYVEVSFTLSDPTGKVLFQDGKADGSQSFCANQYGVYTLVYKATDAVGRTKNLSYSITLFDVEPPVVHYEGPAQMTGKVGTAMTVPSAIAFDGKDASVSFYVFIVEPNGNMQNITQTLQFTPRLGGKHTLRYYAFDSNYNYAMVDVVIEVDYEEGA